MFPDLPLWAYVLITLALTHAVIASVTIYLHRHQAHRALDLHPVVSHLFRLCLWLGTGMVTREWIAVHRKHHARVECSDDPHSPQQHGIGTVLLEGAELYRAEADDPSTLEQFGHGAPDDWVERKLYSRYPMLGVAVMFAIDVLLFGMPGITIWAVQMMWIPIFAAGVINGAGHYWGYRNFESPDASTNIVPLGLLIGGEELHNNHHAFASSARFSSRWFEIDLGWWYIRLLEMLGFARVKKVSPLPIIDHDKQGIDVDTVRAVIAGRMHVMARYAREVTGAVYREERAKANRAARRLLRRGRRLLVRHESLIDESSRARLNEMLASHQSLHVVYEYRRRLQSLWQQRMVGEDSLIEALQEWCHEAEKTGIEALENFARGLRGYTLRVA